MATKKSSSYWQGRFDQVEQAANNKAVKHTKQLDKKYKAAMQEIDTKINSWYARIAKNNEITVEDARKLLSKSELNEFKWTVEQYIEAGRQNAIDQRWMKELENASAKFHINRLEALKLECRQQIEVALANGQQAMFDTLSDVYKDSFYQSCFEVQKGFGVGFDVSKLDNSQVSKLLNKPWSIDGENFSSKLWTNKTKLINTLDQELSKMVMTGASPKKAIKNIQQAMNTSLSNAKRLVLTEQAYFTTLGQKDAFGELDVEEYEIVSTLDSKTSEICQQMDGQHFPLKDMQLGVNAPPFHPYCRTTTCPYFNDEFSLLDKRVAKNEDTGEWYEVDANMTYPEWKKSFVGGGSKDGLPKINVDKTDISNYTKVRTSEELQEAAQGIVNNISNYTNTKSKWSGNINVDNSLKLDGIGGQKEWNCDITLIDTADDGAVWHELLHSCSVSHFDAATYLKHQNIEEASVEFLKQQICKEKGIINTSAYEDLTTVLQTLNDNFKYGTDMEFAKELFDIPLPDRYQWLEDRVDDSLKQMEVSFEDYNDVMKFVRTLKGGI